jgi:hypothetical protein
VFFDEARPLSNTGVVREFQFCNPRKRSVTGDHVHTYDCDPAFAQEYAAP